jgi:HSP20 family protein
MIWPRFRGFGLEFDPWREFERLQGELYRVHRDIQQRAGEIGAPGGGEFPLVNMWRNDSDVRVTAEVPGVDPKDIDISVIEKTVTIKGVRKTEENVPQEAYHRSERGYGTFSRTFELPFRVNADKVEAKFSKGVLYLTLPRAEEDKPRKISIKMSE